MNLNHFEATTVMQLAEQLNVPLVVFVTNNINSELKKLIKPEDFELVDYEPVKPQLTFDLAI